jgi:hypothetical protein
MDLKCKNCCRIVKNVTFVDIVGKFSERSLNLETHYYWKCPWCRDGTREYYKNGELQIVSYGPPFYNKIDDSTYLKLSNKWHEEKFKYW